MKVATIVFVLMASLPAILPAQPVGWEGAGFHKADSIAALYPHHSLDNVRTLAHKLTAALATDHEKFRAIHTWVCSNIEFDYTLYQKNKRKRESLKNADAFNAWNKQFCAEVFRKLRTDHKTICTGYAYIVRELAAHAGITCVIVDGYGRTAQMNVRGSGVPNHSWNAVKLNGRWYLCDPTWSSGIYDKTEERFVKTYNNAYFLADPDIFARNHYPLDTTWLLKENKPDLNGFLNAPLIYSDAFHYGITRLSPQTLDTVATKGATVSFCFAKTGIKNIEKAALRIVQSGTTNTVYPELLQDTSGRYRIEYPFTTKGTHVVNLLLNDAYVVTYTIKVR